MMTGFRKSWLPLMLTVVLSLGIATAAWAGPQGMGGGLRYGHGMGGDCGRWAPAWVRAMAAAWAACR